ncbi:alpha/beta hydrolase family protein [Mycobacterium xenopi 4042]|uniref:Alpha/beta hydrolase family protein n=1 Tax=Mycobacterium xenopi 4042 TaxID=1299334 RepID=X8E8U8_MYCXE|nr:alpha/beta hydrolase family protein [Mycobacterium xenopi 4042]
MPDVLPGYWQHTIPLGPDPHGEGDIAATLVRRGEPTKTDHAVLAVHGYTDYFFNAALADHFAERGFAFYALDMHKCGRSWRAGQTPHFATDLADYDRELDSALAVIRAQSGPPTVLVYGHSTGGLIVSLWLDRLRRRGATAQAGIGGLVLNSPWLDLHGSPVLRWAVTSVLIAAVARLHGKGVARTPARADTAPACIGTTTASSITTCSGNPRAAFRSPSAGSTLSGAARLGCIAGSTSACRT